MMMSSCSQEDVQVPEPSGEEVGIAYNPHRGIVTGPEFPTTNGPAGIWWLAQDWKRLPKGYPGDNIPEDEYPTGTSSLTHLWGDQSKPWIKPLPQPTPSAYGVATFTMMKNMSGNIANATVFTKLKNLTPGKKYSVKIYGASSIAYLNNGYSHEYGRGISIEAINGGNSLSTILDLTGKEAEWVIATLAFTAASDEVTLKCSGYADDQYIQSHPDFYHQLNVYADKHSIKEVL
jgi:hypothetical protein